LAPRGITRQLFSHDQSYLLSTGLHHFGAYLEKGINMDAPNPKYHSKLEPHDLKSLASIQMTKVTFYFFFSFYKKQFLHLPIYLRRLLFIHDTVDAASIKACEDKINCRDN
jgi:hypothetical protein